MLCDDLEGRVGERLSREGLHVYSRMIPVAIQQKPTEHSKAIVSPIKIFFNYLLQ